MVPIAKTTKPISNSGKLYSDNIWICAKWPMIPSKPLINPIIHVIFFGAEGLFIELVFKIRNEFVTENQK